MANRTLSPQPELTDDKRVRIINEMFLDYPELRAAARLEIESNPALAPRQGEYRAALDRLELELERQARASSGEEVLHG